MAKREVLDHYTGRVLGAGWIIAHPLIQIGIYLFIFGVIFKPDVEHPSGLPINWTVYLLSGLIPWLAFLDAMNRSSLSMINNANLVKQVVFPIEILPIKGIMAATVPHLVMWILLLAYMLLQFGMLPWTIALLPLLLMVQLLAMVGVGFVLAPVGAYFRDLKDVIQVFGMVGLFLTPTLYRPESVPVVFKPLLYVNPVSYMIWCYQDVCYFGSIDHPWAWVVFGVLSLSVFVVGFRIFEKLKTYLGNVL
jgi:lipopolysaccharide transport system permease protein